MSITIIKRQAMHGALLLTETRYIIEFSLLQALVSCLAVLFARVAFYSLRAQKIIKCNLAEYLSALQETMIKTMQNLAYSLLPRVTAV